MENCTYGFGPSTSTIALPTLKSLAVVPRRYTSRHYTLIVTSPRVTCLRLFLPFTRTHAAAVRIAPEGREVLESLVSASISILDMEQEPNHLNRRMNKHKVDFLTSTRSMLDRFPNVRNLDLSGFTTIALLDKKSQEFPMLQNLRTLLLSDCDVGVRCHALRSILLNAPNLEHLRLQHCKFIDTPKRKRGNTKSKAKPSMCLDSLSSLCKNLQSMEIKWQLVDIGLQHLVEFIKEILTGRKLHFKRTIRGGMITVSIQIRSRTSIA
ncbi:MEIOTIC F-BOX protein MOF-like [Oryza brachyantha]|uniref:MEIOTIC F-BOX protein MOF-like n=1 Tax=Oryza brachyantha TaxID=4533 RepID=UPI00077633E3|nr:MEIOTIC F-BOX protein MOF-like [Oryza brachyantha]